MPAPRTKKPRPLALRGALWIDAGTQRLGDGGRMALLKAVAEQGSITQAAKAHGISYKAAWDAIDAMNTLAGEPLVERVTGGRGGGSTRLTERGRRLLARYEEVDAVHRRFMQVLDAGGMNLDEEFSLVKVLQMKTSARNQWVGTVVAVRAGSINDEVELALADGTRLAAIVTRDSTEWLGLKPRKTAIALVKAPNVLLATQLGDARVATRNRIEAVVQGLTPGAVNTEVQVATAGGLAIVAIVPHTAVAELALRPGAAVTVLIKASDVVLAVVD